MNDNESKPRRKKSRPSEQRADTPTRKPRKKIPSVYVPPHFPRGLLVASFVWALVGWVIASHAPNLAFVPLIGVLHYLFPAVTVVLIAVNAYGALRNLWAGVHPLRLLVVTGLQIGLFTTLFYQLFAHVGAEHFEVGPSIRGWHFLLFSAAHALRAADILDGIEAFNLKIQMVKHNSALTAVFVIAYHAVVDTFILGMLWRVVDRVKHRLMKDDGIRDLVQKVAIATFVLWLLVWALFAFGIHRWHFTDIPLWFLENFLRV